MTVGTDRPDLVYTVVHCGNVNEALFAGDASGLQLSARPPTVLLLYGKCYSLSSSMIINRKAQGRYQWRALVTSVVTMGFCKDGGEL